MWRRPLPSQVIPHFTVARSSFVSSSLPLYGPKKLSQAKQKEVFPGLRREIRKFEGEHTFSHAKNNFTVMKEGKALFVLPAMFAIMSVVQYFFPLPEFCNTWTFFGGYLLLSCAAARWTAMGRRNRIQADLTGKYCIITGATSGMGLATAKQLVAMGCHVHILARESPKVPKVLEEIRSCAKPNNNNNTNEGDSSSSSSLVTFTAIDLADLVAVRDFTRRAKDKLPPVDLLINNAGVLRSSFVTTRFGDDEMLVVNFLAPYLLTEGLLPQIKAAHGRIVNVSGSAHVAVKKLAVAKYLAGRGVWKDATKYDGLEQLGFTKLGLIYHTQMLAIRSYPVAPLKQQQSASRHAQAAIATGQQQPLQPTSLDPDFTVCAVTPGGVVTHFYRHVPMGVLFQYLYYLFILCMRTPWEGSQTIVNSAVRRDLVNGGYYMDCRYMPTALSEAACNVEERRGVMEWIAKKLDAYLK